LREVGKKKRTKYGVESGVETGARAKYGV
jgi:hypothetical protein